MRNTPTANLRSPWPALTAHALALAVCGLIALLAMPLRQTLDLANIIMLFLLGVFLVALRLGRGAAATAAVASVALFDFFFVPPHLGFIPTDAQYVITLVVMLAVALITARLTADTREHALMAQARERQTEKLYQLARDLAGVRSRWDVQVALDAYFEDSGYRALLHSSGTEPGIGISPLADAARQAVAGGKPVPDSSRALFLPLLTPTSPSEVLVVTALGDGVPSPEQDRVRLGVVASLTGIAMERLDSVKSAEQARLQAASDKLRASLLSALSHDLRTPLTALVATADSLALGKIPPDTSPGETAMVIRDQARSMEHLLGNLLEMARLQAGRVQLRKDWQLMDDVVAAGLRHLRLARNNHAVRVNIAPDLPLIRFDAVLMERVVWNLLENAVKYSPPDAPVDIRAGVDDGKAYLSVCDRGPGFPADRLESLFDLFVRGEPESALPGVGLGLAICRAIVEVHGGTIRAENRVDGGACVTLWLPMDAPPPIEDEEADEAES